MRLLALDTATSAITVAVHDGQGVLAERTALDARRHTELLAPLVQEALDLAGLTPDQLTDVAVGTGPGPFTGLRVGLVTARTMGLALGIPVHGVCSLDALAHEAAAAGATGELLVATDARRREVYHARYRCTEGRAEPLEEPAVTRPGDLADEVRALPTVGRGPLLYPELLTRGGEPLDVSAAALAELAVHRIRSGAPMPAEPLYLRRPDAATPGTAKSALAAGGPARSAGRGTRARHQQVQPTRAAATEDQSEGQQ